MSFHPLLNCRKCGSTQVEITPMGLVDFFRYKVKATCLLCGSSRTSVMILPQDTWDVAEQNKNVAADTEPVDVVLDYDNDLFEDLDMSENKGELIEG